VVRRALRDVPLAFRAAADNVIITVEPYPKPDDYERRHGEPRDTNEPLFGVYRGVPLSERSAAYGLAAPDVIAIFRRPLLAACRTRRELRHEVELTVLHELGHHFGLEEPAVEHL
jgi:predicted Zn-dependent protease with MMP-like domain